MKKNHLQLPLERVRWIHLQLVLSITSSLNEPYSTKWKYRITKGILLSFHLWCIVSHKTLFPGSIPLSSVCESSYVWILLIALWDCRWLKKKECSRKWDLPFDFSSIFSICCNSHIHTHTRTCTLVSKCKVIFVVKMSETDLAKNNFSLSPFPFHKPV